VLLTGLAVAVGAAVFALVGWAHMESLAAALTVLVGMAGLGVSIWAGIRHGGTAAAAVLVTESGSVRGHSGLAVTGVDASGTSPGKVVAEKTGDVEGGDDAVTGYRQR
jgi:hypothetical protein